MMLTTLGGLELSGEPFRRHKPLLVAAYLALEGPQERRYLAELLWPRAADPRQSLTVALSQLNAVAPGMVASDGARLASNVACDAVLLREAAADHAWSRLVELHKGPFLAGVELDRDNPEFEEWVYGTRELLAMHAHAALVTLGEERLARGDTGEAARLAERAAALVPDAGGEPERMLRLHELLAATGNPRSAALRLEALEQGVQLPDPAAARRQPSAHNLPGELTRFIGRRAELAGLGELLMGGARLVTITGLGGMGKTRLALELARQLASSGRFEQVLFVPVGVAATPDGLEPLVLAAASAARGLASPPPDLLRAVGVGPTLLVLDDLDQLVGSAAVLEATLARAPLLSLVVTARTPLGLAAETQFLLGGLELPVAGATGDAARESDAVELFRQTVRRYDLSFELREGELADVTTICGLVAGAPLGIELAAALTRVIAPAELAAELSADLAVLAAAPGPAHRNAGLGALFGSSWNRLTDDERGALAGCAIFAGGFTRRAARQVLGIGLPELGSLLDKSLLRRQGDRYELHPLVRQYAAERLAARAEAEAWREAHATHYCAWFDSKRPYYRRSGQRLAFEELGPDLPNLQAAWRWAVGGGRVDLLERAAFMAACYLIAHGRAGELTELLDEAEPVIGAGTPLHAQALRYRAWCLTPEEPFQARLLLDAALELHRALGADDAVGPLFHDLGVVNAYLGDVAAARRYWLDAAPLLESADDEQLLGATYSNLSLTTAGAAEHDRWAARAHATCLERGATTELVVCLANQSTQLAYSYGDYAGALALLDEAARLEESEVGREVFLARFHYIAVFHLVNMDRTGPAAQRLAEARRLLEHHRAVRDDGSGQYPPFAWAEALLHHARGELAEARRALATRPHDALCRELACRLALEAGEPAAAAEHLAALKGLKGFGIATRARLHEQVVARLLRAELLRQTLGTRGEAEPAGNEPAPLAAASTELAAALEGAVEHTFVPLALEGLVVAAALAPARFGREPALVADHPAARYFVRRRASLLVARGGAPRGAATGRPREGPGPATPDEVLRRAADVAGRLGRKPNALGASWPA